MAKGKASGIKAGEAYVLLSLVDDASEQLEQWGKKWDEFGNAMVGIGAGIAAAGAVILAPLIDAVATITELGSQINDLSEATGLSTTGLQTLGFAAGQTGASQDDLANGVKKSQKLLAAAAKGSKEAGKALAGLGLSTEQLMALSPDDRFREMGLAVGAIEDPALRTAAAMAVFGKTGTKLIPMFARGRQALASFEQQIMDAGAVLTPDQIKWADAFGDALSLLSKQFTGLKGALAGALLPALTGFAAILSENLPKLIEWVNTHQEATQAAAVTGGALLTAGTGLLAFGGAIIFAGSTMASLGTIAGFVSPIVLGGIAAIGTAAAALVSPIGIAIAAVAALGAAILYFTGGGETALRHLQDGFVQLYQTATTTLGGIFDAIAGKDLELAGRIAMLGLAAAFLEGAFKLREIWAGFRDWFVNVWQTASASIQVAFINIMAAIESAWASLTGGGDVAIARIEEIRRSSIANVGDESANVARDQQAATNKELANARVMMDLANDQLDRLRGQAAEKRAAVIAAAPGGGGDDDPLAAVGGASRGPVGSFNSAILSRLVGAGGGVQQQQLQELREIKEVNQALLDAFLDDDGPTFE